LCCLLAARPNPLHTSLAPHPQPLQCDIFFARGIARPETREVSSLSVEEHPGAEIVVSLFEVEASPESIAAFIQREHEFRWGCV
jgi:hypothetical protein